MTFIQSGVNILQKCLNFSGALFSNIRKSTGFLRGNFHSSQYLVLKIKFVIPNHYQIIETFPAGGNARVFAPFVIICTDDKCNLESDIIFPYRHMNNVRKCFVVGRWQVGVHIQRYFVQRNFSSFLYRTQSNLFYFHFFCICPQYFHPFDMLTGHTNHN